MDDDDLLCNNAYTRCDSSTILDGLNVNVIVKIFKILNKLLKIIGNEFFRFIFSFVYIKNHWLFRLKSQMQIEIEMILENNCLGILL